MSLAIIFDLSGIIFNNGLEDSIKKIRTQFNIKEETAKFVLNGTFAEKYRKGLIKNEEFWRSAKEYLNLDEKQINQIKKIFFESYRVQKQALELIKEIKKHNIKIAFLSNSPEDRTQYLEKKFNFKSIFDFGLFSYQVQCLKPDEKIYRKLIEKFNLIPENTIFIDDNTQNLDTAKNLGMKTILFTDFEHLKIDLTNFLDSEKETLDPNYIGEGIYKENILDHYKNPHNKGIIKDANIKYTEHNPVCGDVISVNMNVNNNTIQEIKFIGRGCAISQASMSMLTDEIKDKDFKEINSKTASDIISLLGIEIGPVRTKCAVLGLVAVKNGIKEYLTNNKNL